MNENYPLANPGDPNFDKPHPYTKSAYDGTTRGQCRCGKSKGDPIHIEQKEK